MNPVEQTIGYTLGHESVEKLVEQVEKYCECERQFIEATNLPALKAGRAEIALLLERKQQLEEKIQQLPPEGDMRTRRRYALGYWTLVAFLVGAGTYFTKLSFDPFQSATNPYLYAVGIALTITFLGDQFLSNAGKYANQLYRTVLTVAFVATLTALVLLAVIRGDLLMQKLQSETTQAVTIDESAPAIPQNNFYQESALLLCITLPLVAIGMDLGAGLALHEARRFGAQCTDEHAKLCQELNLVNQQLILKLAEITSLEKAPAVFEWRFWRDFWRAMLTHAERHAMQKLFIAVFAILLLFAGRVFAQDSSNMVILVDLSKSVAANTHRSPCKENFKAVSRVLENAPAGTSVTILGITADSFGDPDVLLSAKISSDRGYFGERLSSAHQKLEDEWQKRSGHLECNARGTDILGAILVAAQIFKTNPATHSELLIFSDMRQNTKEINLGMIRPPKSTRTLNTLAVGHLIADLQGVSVEVLGADNAGDDLEHWQKLETFWRSYFKIANAELETYSVMRVTKDR